MSKKRGKRISAKNHETTVPQDKIAAKKAAVLGTKKNNRLPLIAIVACGILAIGGSAYYVMNGPQIPPGKVGQTSSSQVVSQSATLVMYPASHFLDGIAKHFQYQHEDITIKYFILRSSDGVIRAAFDACDVCWPAGKGYYQDGDSMVCRNCGRRFASIMVNEVQGGCNPSPLNRAIKDDQVIIQVEDILKGRQYFDFS